MALFDKKASEQSELCSDVERVMGIFSRLDAARSPRALTRPRRVIHSPRPSIPVFLYATTKESRKGFFSGAPEKRRPSAAVFGEKEERRSERETAFQRKVVASVAKLATTWSG